MNIEHFQRGLQYSERDFGMMERKIGKLAKYCKKLESESSSIRVEAERRPTKKERDSVKVMITVDLPRKLLRAESRRGDVLDALERCIEKLEPQIKKYKELHTARGVVSLRGRREQRRLSGRSSLAA